MRTYAGIGSRKTPDKVLASMTQIAARLRERGFILRSGGAVGADEAFEVGAQTDAEIYVPGRDSQSRPGKVITAKDTASTWKAAEHIARGLHPNWDAPGMLSMGAYGQRAHTRNVFQILGPDLYSPVSFVVCWAPEVRGKVQGGTATAVTLALRLKIPVFNLLHGQSALNALGDYVRWLDAEYTGV